jgi:hypothetical protein
MSGVDIALRAPLPSSEQLRKIASDAGAVVAKDTLARILAGEISKWDVEATSARLASFVADCIDDMREDGHGQLDLIVFRDACVHGFRLAWSGYRIALAELPGETLQ